MVRSQRELMPTCVMALIDSETLHAGDFQKRI